MNTPGKRRPRGGKNSSRNVSDISQAHALLHGEEERAGGDAGYTGVEKRAEIMALGREID